MDRRIDIENPKHRKECPNEFYPERFENLEVDFLGNHFEMISFGDGRRSCSGIKSATSITELSSVNLLYWFDWEVADGEKNEDLEMEEEYS
ncbi:cytochrome P450 [Cynara cardunculus var. scolymus]|uniref:Cytochrome P450 n=1 Tax=Cynara cardunculus var. scolymus TaxID=59895 RepID=A0A118JVD9_CYNCS|nr:cytochrome P450 [Cynara cardunculus var. scolymus]